jgi:N-acetyltransferase
MSARDSTTNLVTVDCPSSTNSDKGLFAHPDPLPTPLGISRIFVASSQRRKGVGSTLLDSICRTFIHGYVLDPKRGEVAFTQPTGDGRALMLNWGGEDVRVYDESTIAS